MDIKINSGVEALTRGLAGPIKARSIERPKDTAAFERTTTFEAALRDAEDVRPDVVARARELVNNSSYPPPETIKKLSNLLAVNMQLRD